MKTNFGSSDRPLWSEELSVHAAEDNYVLRRQFTKFLVLTSAGMFAGNLWILIKSQFAHKTAPLPERVIATVSDLPVGEVKLFNYPGPNDSCILVHPIQGPIVAYSQKCTHLSCAVYYSKEKNRLECPCHEGYFAIDDGRVLQGPPPRPLPRVQLEQRGDQLIAIGLRTEGETT